jgi:molecular chaperone GrpE
MWQTPPPDTAGNSVSNGQEVLTSAAIEAVLADFRSWLQHLSQTPPAEQPAEPPQFIDLHTLLAQFVALRHEVNLQTKAARSQQELNGQTLQQLSQAMEVLRQTQAAAQQTHPQAQDEALRPLLKTLLDVHDAFSLAEREIGRTGEAILPLLDELASEPSTADPADADEEPGMEAELETEPMPTPPPKPSLWQRWFGRRPRAANRIAAEEAGSSQASRRYEPVGTQERLQKLERTAERVDQLLDSVLTGYRMSLQRLERSLRQSGLEPIACVGRPFDPEQMEVVAVVADSGHPAGEVLEEVRRGYLWRGRVFRYAQVSVAKG